jgi:hypothetical protein
LKTRTLIRTDIGMIELSETLRPRGVLFCSNPRGDNEEASAVPAITASSISTPGAIMLELPDSSRWDTTTARRDFRGTSSRGSRPYGAKASRRHVEAEHLRGLRVDRQVVLAMVAAWGCYSPNHGHVVLGGLYPTRQVDTRQRPVSPEAAVICFGSICSVADSALTSPDLISGSSTP